MSSTNTPTPIVDEKTENPTTLGYAGSLLFALGLIAVFIAYFGGGVDRISMVLYATVLLSMGYPMLLYVRALKKIAALEQRLAALEHRAEA
jgi:ABC-type sugar transport system permease subunit